MADLLHSTHTNIYRWETWVFTDAADRDAGGAFDISYDDIGKIGYQSDTRTYWRLSARDSTGLAWTLITGISTDTGARGWWAEPVANGDPTTPEIVFSDGDVVMTFVRDLQ